MTNRPDLKPLPLRKRWFERFASFLERFGEHHYWPNKQGRCRISIGGRRMIYREGDDGAENYLERFYVLSTPWLGIYLHRFWAGDDDGLHDHPWNSVSVLLSGSYNEEMPERRTVPYGPSITKRRRPLRPPFFVRTKHDAHRITLPEDEDAPIWSLFIRFGLKRRKWGFYRHRGWEAAEVQSRAEELANAAQH